MADDLHQLGEELIRTCALVVRWARAEHAGLSVAGTRILSRVNDAGRMRIGDLAIAERSSQPTITNHVKRMEALGLLTRCTDPDDARVSLISVTPAGRAKLSAIRQQMGTYLAPRLAALPDHDQHTIRHALDLLEELVNVPR
jgi:DNA-binding MarR family transcriptional regulator